MTDLGALALEISAQKWGWMSQRDVAALAELFHDDVVFVHMGATLDRTQELEVIESGRIQYREFDITETSVRTAGNTAIVLTTMTLASTGGGNDVSNPFVTTETYVDLGGSIRLVAMAFTRLLTP